MASESGIDDNDTSHQYEPRPPITVTFRTATTTQNNMENSQEKKRARKLNFSDDEILVLIREVMRRKHILLDKREGTGTCKLKRLSWEAVTRRVNAVRNVKREREEIRKKFIDFRSLVKKRAMAIDKELQRGGETNDIPPLRPTEKAMLSAFNDAEIEGIPHVIKTEDLKFDENDVAVDLFPDGSLSPRSEDLPPPGSLLPEDEEYLYNQARNHDSAVNWQIIQEAIVSTAKSLKMVAETLQNINKTLLEMNESVKTFVQERNVY